MSVRVESSKPFTLVYSLCKHEFLGYLIEPHVVQMNLDGSFSLTHQRIFSNTASDFSKVMDDNDLLLIKLLEEVEQSQIIKRFYKKHIRPASLGDQSISINQQYFVKIPISNQLIGLFTNTILNNLRIWIFTFCMKKIS